MAEILSVISIISLVLACVCLVLAVIFFVRFKIPSVIGDLSGRNARRSIEQMRQTNMKGGDRSFRSSQTNIERGKLTETMHNTGMEGQQHNRSADETQETEILAETGSYATADPTELLVDENATELLADENVTAPLNPENQKPAEEKKRGRKISIELSEEIMFVHTEEEIR